MTATPEWFGHLDLYTVLDSLPDGVTLADDQGRIVFSNAAADRILGTEAPPDAPPHEWAEHFGVYLPDGKTSFPTDRYPLVRAVAGEETRGVEMLIRNASVPEGVLIAASGKPLRDRTGALIGAAVVFRDITELRRAQRLKDELAAFIIHDLKSPLTTIIGTSDLIALDHGDNAEILEDLQTIRVAAHRINRMVLDLLDSQMADDGALEPALADIDLATLFRTVREAAVGRMATRDRERVIIGDVDGLRVRADQELLFRSLMNLVDNCVKYGPGEGKIRVDGTATEHDTVLITVEDQGPGVPPSLRERIFDKYARVERAVEHRAKDSRGLGLRFCRVVAEAHGGRIWAEDAEPHGTRFCLTLPAAR